MASNATAPPARWPACAEEYAVDAPTHHVNDDHARRAHHQQDPRPNAGLTCAGRYLPDDWRACDARRQYHCLPCGLRKSISVNPADTAVRYRLIRFACPACRTQTKHAPVGTPRRLQHDPFDDAE